ncbi:uncharacterized protein B0I36DRAFT_350769 [Microdochium trichocladiopsis]|uniref:Uncharacterized protein n=1 Tax=Microdochium trichocladiopsis TaxID=1682393 RepID=A0A9P9BMZ6_9PEZI|nr:uncharacterized protein B0I36DRAFT_350769 [Microdochium trichocladiopsis]KAH7027203.1 hypothetical protein B0I36DRAFT_350769 [Microdochium trichocladiopsis]
MSATKTTAPVWYTTLSHRWSANEQFKLPHATTDCSLDDDSPTYIVPDVDGAESIRVRRPPHMTHDAVGNDRFDDHDKILDKTQSKKNAFTLLSRGWVLQERLLSPPIMYFRQGELKWECNKACDFLCGAILSTSNFNLVHRRSLRAAAEGGEALETSLTVRWIRVAERYSRCALTSDSGRVVALAGMAAQAITAVEAAPRAQGTGKKKSKKKCKLRLGNTTITGHRYIARA